MLVPPLRVSAALSNRRSPPNVEYNVRSKGAVVREPYGLREQQLPAWQLTEGVVLKTVACVKGALVPEGLQTASVAPPGEKAMLIMGREVVVRVEDLLLGGWRRCIVVGAADLAGGDDGVGDEEAGVPGQHLPKLNEVQAAETVDVIFGSISANDIRQQAGRTYDNADEELPSGVSLVLAAVGPLNEADVFHDVGAGVGNILAQVALTTDVRVCVDIELRGDLVSLGQRCMQQQIKHHPRLGKVLLKRCSIARSKLAY
ncbi:hypothetical protein PC110_g21465 [Phytophthora cactorum]|uniref:DOT1 domain-containing protein n=2 Tax=Phytophthora cactorum TaxID=29920 RepID=A0A329RBY9_9STRA|nr:hypothetical protein PC111_g22021 [Phytophthora cactorum]KAG2880848.1 hypothetical protein PC115_g22395 [Phytophthora cactorum]KAG2966344.1 hypothetical protein PC119_g24738 [Phytophthora cactorum]KAG3127301.1 hypothetical protein C6341_g25029 [Phytophthora cactorum]RAW22094.1 hypothetical protein PC110_g21465 [Phytophthora cactorum]